MRSSTIGSSGSGGEGGATEDAGGAGGMGGGFRGGGTFVVVSLALAAAGAAEEMAVVVGADAGVPIEEGTPRGCELAAGGLTAASESRRELQSPHSAAQTNATSAIGPGRSGTRGG